jgi:hypothetical protein
MLGKLNIQNRFEPLDPELFSFLTVPVGGIGSEHFEWGHPERVAVSFLYEVTAEFRPVFVKTVFLELFSVRFFACGVSSIFC